MVISIHSPLAGRDRERMGAGRIWLDFNPLAPRGARLPTRSQSGCDAYISIHSPLAGRDGKKALIPPVRGISIHSPLAGRDIARS